MSHDLETRFIDQLTADQCDTILFLESRLVQVRGLFGVSGVSPPVDTSLLMPSFDHTQLSTADFFWVQVWDKLGLLVLYEVSETHANVKIKRAGFSFRVTFSAPMWRIAWRLRLRKSNQICNTTHYKTTT